MEEKQKLTREEYLYNVKIITMGVSWGLLMGICIWGRKLMMLFS